MTYLFAIGKHLNRHDCHGENARICIQPSWENRATSCACRNVPPYTSSLHESGSSLVAPDLVRRHLPHSVTYKYGEGATDVNYPH